MIPRVLTIAGSDPSGGAGIQADLKTFSALKIYGMAVLTCLTAQNTRGVSDVLDLDPGFVAAQIDSVMTDLRPEAVKTGMLLKALVIHTVATKVREHRISNLVVDPVMNATAGMALLDQGAVHVLRNELLPLALVVTPNTGEAERLTGRAVRTISDMEAAARQIHAMGPRNVLIKGGHLEGDAVDVLFNGSEFSHYQEIRIPARDSHGTGCVLSAAIAGYLALGRSLPESVQLGKVFVTAAIRRGLRMGSGPGPCDPIGVTNGT